jgi:hypothetical protein
MSELTDLGSSFFETEFDGDTNLASFSLTQAWFVENLGLLNTLIHSQFSGEDPGLGLEEKAIYKQLFLLNYYSRQARNVLRGITSTNSSDNIIMVADESNKIQFTNKNEVSKTYRDLAKDAKQQLDSLVAKYNIYASKPLQVGGIEAQSASSTSDLTQESISTQDQLDSAIQQLVQYSIDSGNQVTLDGGSDD